MLAFSPSRSDCSSAWESDSGSARSEPTGTGPEQRVVDVENKKLRTMEEQLELNSEKEISDYCVSCGACCFFGPAACSKLKIITDEN